MRYFILLFSFFNIIILGSNMSVEIPSVFSDNMVLQQNSTAKFWGRISPASSDQVKIIINADWGETGNALANADGTWRVDLKTPAAGGPYNIRLQAGDTTIAFKNVLIGEVWICSGQSNMEMPLQGWPPNDTIMNFAAEIENAGYPLIRNFNVVRTYSNKREFNCQGSWVECSPQTAGNFSATAYFFARKLHKELGVPVGIITTSWGGTPVETWISGEYIGKVKEYENILSDLESSSEDFKKYQEWLLSHPVLDLSSDNSPDKWEDLDFKDKECSAVEYPDQDWKAMNLPTLWEETSLGDLDGVVWFRKKISLPEAWINQDLVLEIGQIDDMDRTFVNGVSVGSIERLGFWSEKRIYKVPKEIVKSEIVIAVRVIDNQGGGGIYGSSDGLKIYRDGAADDTISLAGNWKYLPVAEYKSQKFYLFGTKENDFYSKPPLRVRLSQDTPTALFNAMINPLIPYSINGAIWYQGEANVHNPEMYEVLFPLMIENWRTEWGNDFGFYYVQIAPFRYGEGSHSERLREAQFKSLSVPHSGMTVTLDIGDLNTIHPANKQDVGERLARLALAKDYGREIKYSGPLFKEMIIEDGKAVLSFEFAEDGLVLKPYEGKTNFLIAGEDKVFKEAEVKTDGSRLIVSNPEVKNPSAVRYAWSDTAAATIFNKEGLPASSFRTDNWKDQ